MKKFNLEEFKKDPSQKVITKDGREVRIICTDAKGDKPIIALVYNNRNEENVYAYNRDGYFYKDSYSCLDLFFATVKKEWWVNNGIYLCKVKGLKYLNYAILYYNGECWSQYYKSYQPNIEGWIGCGLEVTEVMQCLEEEE